MTFTVAAEVALTPLHERWQRWMDLVGEKTIRRIQWGHLFLSLAVLWFLLGHVERHSAGSWVGNAVLSVLYLAAFLFLTALLSPRDLFWRMRGLHRLTKLGLIVNYFTALLLLQILIGTWRERAGILAGLFVVSFLGAWMLCRIIWPVHLSTVSILMAGGGGGFDPSDPQGRTIESE